MPVLLVLAGLAAGFAAGFILANGVNRQEQEKLRAELARLRAGASGGASSGSRASLQGGEEDFDIPTLTDGQLGAAVARADASPDDAGLQKTSGQALYLYAMQKGNFDILPDVARILARAHELDPRDAQLTALAGNAHFLVARRTGDTEKLKKARAFYTRALEANPDDADARTSLGLTYFYDNPPDPLRAAGEYRRALAADPRAEPPLQGLVAALVAAGDFGEAERRLAELAAVNPNNAEIPKLRAQLEQKRNAAKEAQ